MRINFKDGVIYSLDTPTEELEEATREIAREGLDINWVAYQSEEDPKIIICYWAKEDYEFESGHFIEIDPETLGKLQASKVS